MTIAPDWQAPLDRDRPKVPIEQQISEVRRELALRKNVYPKFVASGKLRQAEADECLRRLQGAHDTLVWVQGNADRIKAAIAAEKEG